MSIFKNNFLMSLDKPQIKSKNKSKKIIPSKPSYLLPSSTLKHLKEKEGKILIKETNNKINNHPLNINNAPLRNRNIYSRDMTLTNSALNNSIKNVHILLKNSNIYNLIIANNSIKNFYNNNEYNDENKENNKNKYNTNYNINYNSKNNNNVLKNDKTIIVKKADKFIKESKIKDNIYKKINLKSKSKRRTLSSNMNKIILNNINNNIINENNILKKNNNINEKNNANSSLLTDIITNHRKSNSIMANINENNKSLKRISLDKMKSSRSFSCSIEKNDIIRKNNNLSNNNSINKTLIIENNNNFYNTGNQFYKRLKQIIPYANNKTKITENNSNNNKNNSLNRSFTTNNFIKRFNISQFEKQSKNEKSYNKLLNIFEQQNNENKIKDYFLYIKANNNLITNNTNKFRKKYKTKSISDLSNLDIQLMNKSRDSVLSQKNWSIIESEKEQKKKILKKILKIDSCTIPGYTLSGVKQKNQDSFFLKKNFLGKDEQFFIGICDGHGLFGDLVSQYISEILPLYMKNTSNEDIIKAFIDTNNSLINKTKIDCSLSGTTCTSLIITLDKIISANIGDTRAILAKFENGCYNTVNLSRDHKPTESDEIKRILSEGGVIKQLYNKNKKEYFGPERIWLKNSDIPGLSMSRSFGDNLAHTVGVINIPEIRTFDYTGGEKFIVIASESVWQYIDSDECVRIIKDYYEKNMDAVGALNSLVTEAIKRLKKEENKIEDITAVVIFFE